MQTSNHYIQPTKAYTAVPVLQKDDLHTNNVTLSESQSNSVLTQGSVDGKSSWTTLQLILTWINIVGAGVSIFWMLVVFYIYVFVPILILIFCAALFMLVEIKCQSVLCKEPKNLKHLKVLLIYRYLAGSAIIFGFLTFIEIASILGMMYVGLVMFSMYKTYEFCKDKVDDFQRI
ncbi:hypothetical protein PCE1_001867 [Barthelona sp. PCE]